MHEQIAETQISLDFDTVWSESLLSAWTNVPADLSLFGLQAILFSPVENQNDLELDFKVFFSLLILVVQALYLMNATDATLASLGVLRY